MTESKKNSSPERSVAVKKIPLKAYTKKELRTLYDIPLSTFNQWIKPYAEELGIGTGKYLTVNQVRFIFEKFGIPGEVEID